MKQKLIQLQTFFYNVMMVLAFVACFFNYTAFALHLISSSTLKNTQIIK